MHLSIVIPSLNRQQYLKNTICALIDQSFQDFEIVVIDQSDNAADIVSLIDKRVVFLKQFEKSASQARNLGLKSASGEIVLFLDDDIIIDRPDFLFNHIRHYSDTKCPGVSGAILSADKAFRSTRHSWSYRKRIGWMFFPINYDKQTEIGNGWAGNLSVRREWAVNVGGMDEQYVKGAFREESDFCTRLVKQYGNLVFDPQAYIIHIGAPSGGLRTFTSRVVLKAQHHFDGVFYYLFRQARLLDYPYHLVSFITIFFKKRLISKNPFLFFIFLKRTVAGIFNAIYKMLQGPKLLIIRK